MLGTRDMKKYYLCPHDSKFGDAHCYDRGNGDTGIERDGGNESSGAL